MPDRFLVSAVGAVIEIDVSRRDAEFRSRAYDAWVDARYDGPRRPDAVIEVSDRLDDAAALSTLSTDVTVAALALRRADPVWMLHAAGVADERGHVVVLSAASGTGKTTAARHLSQRYAYVSDETVGIDAHGGVVPYRKPLSIVEPGAPHKAQVALSSIDGSRPLPARLQVAKIVVIDRSPDAPDVPVLDELDIAEALELLGPQTSYLCDGAAPLQRIAALLSATGGAMRLRYREVDEIDEIVAHLLDAAVRPVEQIVGRVSDPAFASRRGAFRHAEIVDRLDLDGRIALLQRVPDGGKIHILDGIGPTLWDAVPGLTLAKIVDAVVAEHGVPPQGDARATVEAALQELRDGGLLEGAPTQT